MARTIRPNLGKEKAWGRELEFVGAALRALRLEAIPQDAARNVQSEQCEKGGIKHRRTRLKWRKTERSELAKWEMNRFGGGILLSRVFFDLTQFNFNGLLFSHKKEDHPHHQDQNH